MSFYFVLKESKDAKRIEEIYQDAGHIGLLHSPHPVLLANAGELPLSTLRGEGPNEFAGK